MTPDLDAYLSLLADQDHYAVVSVLGRSKFELTELVRRDDSAQLFVRKTIDRASGLGEGYNHLTQMQPENPTLQPACLPRIYQCFSTGEALVVVMEYVEGATLDKALPPADTPERLEAVKQLFPQVCSAVGLLHEHGLIHRDLKPSNILVANGQVKLIDFGIARIPHADARADTTKFGTRGYAPPEQFGFGQTDQRSDIYALGQVLGFCLTGMDPDELPVNGGYAQLHATLPPQAQPLLDVVGQATKVDPDQRFLSIGALSAAFENALHLQAVPAAAPAQAPRAQQPAQPTAAQSAKGSGIGSFIRNCCAVLFFVTGCGVLCSMVQDVKPLQGYPQWFRMLTILLTGLGFFAPLCLAIADWKPFARRFPRLARLSTPKFLVLSIFGMLATCIICVTIGRATGVVPA